MKQQGSFAHTFLVLKQELLLGQAGQRISWSQTLTNTGHRKVDTLGDSATQSGRADKQAVRAAIKAGEAATQAGRSATQVGGTATQA